MQFATIKDKKIIYNIFFMNENYLHIYNNLINYTRNKELYKNLNREDNFSDRLTLFLLHFSFFRESFPFYLFSLFYYIDLFHSIHRLLNLA